MAGRDRGLRWEALLNARDLGGLPTAHGVVAPGAIVRSDALYRLNDAGRATLVAHGVRTVIDMRTDAEAVARPYAFDGVSGVVRHHIAQQTDEMWQSLGGRADRFTFDTTMLELAHANFAAIAERIATAPAGGVLYHCEVGKDRTGLMTMLLLDLVGTPRDVIGTDYSLTAVGLAPLFADLVSKADTDVRRAKLEEEARCRAETMVAIHQAFRARHGDAEAYLVAGGVAPSAIEAIRARLLVATPTT